MRSIAVRESLPQCPYEFALPRSFCSQSLRCCPRPPKHCSLICQNPRLGRRVREPNLSRTELALAVLVRHLTLPNGRAVIDSTHSKGAGTEGSGLEVLEVG